MTDLRITTACHESWDGMSAHAQGRHCAACDQTVVDLSGLAPDAFDPAFQAVQERLAAGDRVCVRAPVDAQGQLQAPARRRRRRLLLTNGLAGIIAVALAGCQGSGPEVAARAATTATPRTTAAAPAGAPEARPDQDAARPQHDAAIGVRDAAPERPTTPPAVIRCDGIRLGECSAIPMVHPAEPPLPRERL